jgi:dihydrolipoamide dehydrogenase
MARGQTEGFVKLIAHGERLVGAGIVGADASELIAELALAIEVGASFEDLALTIHPHPTLTEAIHDAAEHGLGRAVHVLNRARKRGSATLGVGGSALPERSAGT